MKLKHLLLTMLAIWASASASTLEQHAIELAQRCLAEKAGTPTANLGG